MALVEIVKKLASFASAMADALCQRGFGDPAATFTAEAGIVVFRVAFERWINASDEPDLPQLVRELPGELKSVTAGKREPTSSTTTRLGRPWSCPHIQLVILTFAAVFLVASLVLTAWPDVLV